MKNYKLEDIEYLRKKTSISYEDAVILLDKHDGDMARALVELEKNGLLGQNNSSNNDKNSSTSKMNNNNGRGFWETISDGLKFLFSKHMTISKGENVIIDLPLALWILLAIIVLPFWIIGVVFVLVFGLKIDFYNSNNPNADSKIDAIVGKASATALNAVNNFKADSKKAESEESIHVPVDDIIFDADQKPVK